MKDNNKNVYEIINAYTPYDEQEKKDKAVMLEFTNSCDDVLTRNNPFGHFSASALVVNEDFTKTLLVHHNVYNGYVLPGGHADGESDFLSVAIREVKEETGIEVKPYSNEIFSIFSAPVPGHIKRGEFIPAHIHYDVLYLLVAKNEDMEKIRKLESENSDVIWRDLDQCMGEDMVYFIRPQMEKLITQIKEIKK